MKILCTADWHIGKKIEGFSRLDEQKEILDQIIKISQNEKVDAVLIAGDCFDTQNPTPEMTKIFMNALAQLSRKGKCPVFVISGNHDNPLFLSASEAFTSQAGVIVLGYPHEVPIFNETQSLWHVEHIAEGMVQIYFKKSNKKIRFLLSPYANSQRLKKDLGTEDLDKKAWEILCAHWEKYISPEQDVTNILLTHHFFLPEKRDQLIQEDEPEEDEGERSIIGTLGAISLEDLPEGLDYVISGHIHKPQKLYSSKSKVFYTGSPLIYSLSESGQEKSIIILDLGRKNKEYLVPLKIQRDIKKIAFQDFDTIYDTLIQEKDHYLILLWQGTSYFTAEEHQKLRSLHPYILRIESCPKEKSLSDQDSNVEKIKEQTIEELFHEFFLSRYQGAKPPEDLLDIFRESLNSNNENKILQRKQGFLPKKIVIKGFYSYKDQVEIDFTQFKDKNFFGIFGNTGSGKSALIEAMILVLFGKVERLGNLSSGSKGYFTTYYSAMNLNSSELFIEFIFEINGYHGIEEYCCRMHSVRNKKDPFDSKHSRNFFIKDQDEWIPLNHTNGEEILGLKYDDFRKTIILQQQDFMGFIASQPKQNAETLKRLFQLERFDIHDNVAVLSKSNDKEIDLLDMQLGKLANCSEDWIDKCQSEQEEHQKDATSREKIIFDITEKLHMLRDLQEKQQQWLDVHMRKKELDARKIEFTQAKKRREILFLINHDDKIKEMSEKLSSYQKQQKELSVLCAEKEEELSVLKEKSCQYSNSCKCLKAEIDSIRKKKEDQPSLSLSMDIHELSAALKNAEQYQDELLHIEDSICDLNSDIEKFANVEQELLKTQDLANHAKDFHGLKFFLKYLNHDSPCPLCGSLEHPNPCSVSNDIDIQKLFQDVQDLTKSYHKLLKNKEILTLLKKERQKYHALFKENLGHFLSVDDLSLECQKLEAQKKLQDIAISELTENLKKREKELEEKEKQYNYLRNKHLEIHSEYSRKDEKLTNLGFELENIKKSLLIFEKERESIFEKFNLTEDLYEEIKTFPVHTDEEIDSFFSNYYQIEGEIESLSKYQIIPIDDISAQISVLSEREQIEKVELSHCQQRIGRLANQIETIEKNLLEKKSLEEKLTTHILRKNNLDILKQMFIGQGFVKFIGNKYLHRLCYSANKRFIRFTQNQFELCPSDTSEDKKEGKILLIDRLAGGSKRDMLTLSGGQSFQAALALALALADESGAGHKFFFIDEGFGSLDENSLYYVLETLRDLVLEEQRMVGVISHIPIMKNEVDISLNVVLDKVKGTQIYIE